MFNVRLPCVHSLRLPVVINTFIYPIQNYDQNTLNIFMISMSKYPHAKKDFGRY